MATSPAQPTKSSKTVLIAPLGHTLGLLALLLAISLGLLRMQSYIPAPGEQHQGNVLHYLAVIACEWVLVLYIWLGSLIPGATRLRGLIGGRWSNLKEVLRDIGLAALFWVAFTVVALLTSLLVRPSHVGSLGFLNPRGVAELTLWVFMSITAGFCEELAFRGYLQKQCLALTGSVVIAVLAQALLFGATHWYQGFKMVIVISVLGILMGIFAHWRKSLRPGMMTHALADIANIIPNPFG
ncbi:MAG: type II CAAX endopeptidase family protein [Terracidiphilus sp.]|jgi:membrane protease YdiL (CAAX protease family)